MRAQVVDCVRASVWAQGCPDAPFSSLRIEVWHRVPWADDAFLGEATIPLVHLMDLEPHKSWVALSDPQGKACLPPGADVSGSVYVETQFSRF